MVGPRVAVVGAGANGASIGADLHRAGVDVTLVEQWPVHVETIRKEAAEREIAPVHHLQHLVVHGLLHLLGHDHATEAEAQEMERLEAEILVALGVADPYAPDPA